MTKVRSREECLQAIQADSAWRKKEISELSSMVDAGSLGLRQTICRSAIVMIYAHWEGFVKTACELYFSHINEVSTRRSAVLTAHFDDLLMWKAFRAQGDHQSTKNPVPFLKMRSAWTGGEGGQLPVDIIDTESNLNSNVLRRLLIIADLDFAEFETKEKLIDERLLKRRNDIAHGNRVSLDAEEYKEIELEIRELIEIFQQKIEKSVQEAAYIAK